MCTTIAEPDKILVVVPIPLLESNSDWEVYQVHNLPVPFNSNNGEATTQSPMVAQYRLEANAIAVNTERTNFVLLTKDKMESCSKPVVGLCPIKSPVYPISLSKFCITALFMNNQQQIKESCRTSARLNYVIPMAEYLTDGYWIVTTQRRLSFSVVCQTERTRVGDIRVEPPLGVVRLGMSCTASNEYMTLLPYYQEESKLQVHDSLQELLLSFVGMNASVWKPLHEAMPLFKPLIFPEN